MREDEKYFLNLPGDRDAEIGCITCDALVMMQGMMVLLCSSASGLLQHTKN
jgi:hypothetical protein